MRTLRKSVRTGLGASASDFFGGAMWLEESGSLVFGELLATSLSGLPVNFASRCRRAIELRSYVCPSEYFTGDLNHQRAGEWAAEGGCFGGEGQLVFQERQFVGQCL